MRRLLPALLLLLLCATLPARPAGAAEVTIYRCVDAKGKLTLRDTPCAQGEQQQARQMQRPQDPPPRPPAPATPVAPPPPVAETRVRVVMPPRPLYECTTPDGERYTSDTGDGNPRWVPLWTLGYPALARPLPQPGPPGVSGRVELHNRHLSGNLVIGTPAHPPALLPLAPAGTWIRDACHALPQAEVCDRLRDRRDTIRRRFFNAQPSERDVLRLEERGINARLDNDCGDQ
jgi:hypothetical protein